MVVVFLVFVVFLCLGVLGVISLGVVKWCVVLVVVGGVEDSVEVLMLGNC